MMEKIASWGNTLKNSLKNSFHYCFISFFILLGGCVHDYPKPSPETPVPEWFDDAKLGIFIHWGIYSVPAYAPQEMEPLIGVNYDTVRKAAGFYLQNGRMPEDPYAEWYLHKLRQPDSHTSAFHREHYGEQFNYYDFMAPFNAQNAQWNPQQWAQTFKRLGARYVVLTTKHHDGVTLWPSNQNNPKLADHHQATARDIVGELTAAVREEGLRMGLYYSGGVDWSLGAEWTVINGDRANNPYSDEYTAYADYHWLELIERYQPDILWNDILYPVQGNVSRIVSEFRRHKPEGIVNNRWYPAAVEAQYSTPEYQAINDITPYKWEAIRGLGYSFGYNRIDDDWTTLTQRDLIHYFVDTVSKNGNLLINIGPLPDGTIPNIQMDRLNALGDWLDMNGEAIYRSRPWVQFQGTTSDDDSLRFTQKDDHLYAIFLDQPKNRVVQIQGLNAPAGSTVTMLGHDTPLIWENQGRHLEVALPRRLPGKHAYVLKIPQR